MLRFIWPQTFTNPTTHVMLTCLRRASLRNPVSLVRMQIVAVGSQARLTIRLRFQVGFFIGKVSGILTAE